MKYIKYIGLFAFFPFIGYSQSVSSSLSSYMQEVREGSFKPIPEDILSTKDQVGLFASIQPYLADSLNRIRSKAYYVVKYVGQNSDKRQVRTQAINKLITGINDVDSGISGKASVALTGFRKEDFNNSQKETLAVLVNRKTPHLDLVLKLVGYVEIERDRFAPIINSNLPFKYKWSAYLALARMGDQNAIDYLLGKLQKAPINDDFIYDFVPDLVYTRQLEIYEFLEKIIQSDEQSCLTADPDASKKILCGYRVMEYLAPVIYNYPLPTDEFGDLQVDDYESALQEVRVWFTQNNNYEIKRDTF